MYIIVDDRDIVTGGYASSFDREGVTTTGIDPGEFGDWLSKASESDVEAVEAFLIGECSGRDQLPRLIRERSKAPVICLRERPSLDDTLGLFAAGVDDVLRKPVHVREILARVGAIARRSLPETRDVSIGDLTRLFRRPRGRSARRTAAAAAARAPHPRISGSQSRPASIKDADLQCGLRHLRRGGRRERRREPHQQAAQEAQTSVGLRSDRLQALPWLLPEAARSGVLTDTGFE